MRPFADVQAPFGPYFAILHITREVPNLKKSQSKVKFLVKNSWFFSFWAYLTPQKCEKCGWMSSENILHKNLMILGFYRLKKSHSSQKIWSFEGCKRFQYVFTYFAHILAIFIIFWIFLFLVTFFGFLGVGMTPMFQINVNMVIL